MGEGLLSTGLSRLVFTLGDIMLATYLNIKISKYCVHPPHNFMVAADSAIVLFELNVQWNKLEPTNKRKMTL